MGCAAKLQMYTDLMPVTTFVLEIFPIGMQVFYTPHIDGQSACLPEDEAAHCTQVLRHRAGDVIRWVDGRGGWYEGVITEAGKKRCVLRVTAQEHRLPERSWRLHLAVAPTKNMDRMEWLMEKAVEIGLDAFTPLLCERSERRHLRADRLEKIAVAAMKQSMQAWLPVIAPLTPLKDFAAAQTGQPSALFIAHCMPNAPRVSLRHHCPARQDVCILIGPEGDFSPAEVEAALTAGFQAADLGPHRYRTETAALVALQTAHFVNT